MIPLEGRTRRADGCNSEIKAQYLFEKETSAIKFPHLQDGSWQSNFKLGFYDYLSLLRYRRAYDLGLKNYLYLMLQLQPFCTVSLSAP